ncbi:tRNA preQ1(34) S-adenosylmethionine ribosyltransferase-isomerase QueA [Pseudoramibacter faecis]|uniref:tRNA preQ1(34) S-adenosylmethionine ribosyltransferase-isomerase QueA n=1 Tax=Pseudoramibacter faecis TaxID=3108534 RepID=UPI002E75BAD4|nr:tRNA preQ1(34) S-adenosylmethionine ribosyltransferase-isomerase QueA [Pseudoramibacter sp. HA2172]
METLRTEDFHYDLPKRLIAQTPAEQRDNARLMAISRATDAIEDRHFHDIIDYLNSGDLLVMNDTKVLPARIFGQKADTGAKVELLLLTRLGDHRWKTMVKPGRRAKPGTTLDFYDMAGERVLRGTIEETVDGGLRVIRFEYDGVFEAILDAIGTMPLPPYIHETLQDQSRYQTVYAEHDGSAAAPTAGLHFTDALLGAIAAKGIGIAKVTLHVGIGTFRPVKAENILDHYMHSERYLVPKETAEAIAATKAAGGRVIAVGTTTVRTLESVARDHDGKIAAAGGSTDIFIVPGFHWQVVDALITNFHLPESTLLMLVSAFYDREKILAAYQHAIDESYRFFSFGDAMFLY